MSTTESQQILTALSDIKRYTVLSAKQMLNMDEAALVTGLSKSRLYALTSTKQIPYFKPRGARYDLQKNAAPVSAKRSKKTKKGGK